MIYRTYIFRRILHLSIFNAPFMFAQLSVQPFALLCRVFLSREFLCPTFFFVKRAKEKQNRILKIVSGFIIHLKIRKYNNSVNKAGI